MSKIAPKARESIAALSTDLNAVEPKAPLRLARARSLNVLTDRTRSLLFAKMHRAKHRYNVDSGKWMTWTGGRWVDDDPLEVLRSADATIDAIRQMALDIPGESDDDDDDGSARKKALKAARYSEQNKQRENMVRAARDKPGMAVRAAELDCHPTMLNVRNGTIVLTTGELLPADPNRLMTLQCATNYEPGSKSTLWENFIHDTTGGDADLARYLQRVLGYVLLGRRNEKHFWYFHGPTDSGKTLTLNVAAFVLGSYALNADPTTWIDQPARTGHTADLARLRGKQRLVKTSEMPRGKYINAARVKSITGRDELTADAKFEDHVDFKAAFALILAGNYPLLLWDSDLALFRRLRVIPFAFTVPDDRIDEQLEAKLMGPSHAPAVLAWLVEGCRMYQADGIGTCAAVEQATADYLKLAARAEVTVDDYFVDCVKITRNHDDFVSNAALQDAHSIWASDNSMMALRWKDQRDRLEKMGAVAGVNKSGDTRGWKGLQLV